jgi:DNA-binding transcriptional regulator of glucitol operon
MKKKNKKIQSVEEVAKIMVENMKDPEFLDRHERLLQKAVDEVLKKRKNNE